MPVLLVVVVVVAIQSVSQSFFIASSPSTQLKFEVNYSPTIKYPTTISFN
jgi:hypothetical protein